MVYRIDNRPKKNRGKYTIFGVILGIIITIGGFYVYDNYKQPIIDSATQIKNTAINEIPKSNPLIKVQQDPVQQHIQSQPQEPTSNIQPENNQQTNIQSTNPIDESSLEKQIHDQINIIRQQNGLKSLIYDNNVAKVAKSHSQDMALNNYFDHNSLDGRTLQDRLYSARVACYPAGENIEQNYQYLPNLLDSIIQSWMNSPEHRDNILSSMYMSEGIGVFVNGDNVLITDDFC